jgi:alcohol dehydrogenase
MSLEDRPKPEISKVLITHRFMLDDIVKAYDTFGNAAKTNALKVIIEA